MTAAQITSIESSFTQSLFQLGPIAFVAGYSLTVSGVAFVLWNAILACTTLGPSGYWKVVHAASIEQTWAIILLFSALYAGRQWFVTRHRLASGR